MQLPYAEDIGHYWKTGTSSPDTWLYKTKKVIMDLGGKVQQEAFGSMDTQAAFMLIFQIKAQQYKVVWPVLPSRTKNEAAARRQAATLLYHDVKAKAMTASVLGVEQAFFSYMMLPDGRVTSEMAVPELSTVFPKLITMGEQL